MKDIPERSDNTSLEQYKLAFETLSKLTGDAFESIAKAVGFKYHKSVHDWSALVKAVEDQSKALNSLGRAAEVAAQRHRELSDYELCDECGQPTLPEGVKKKPNEYDHAKGCSKASNG